MSAASRAFAGGATTASVAAAVTAAAAAKADKYSTQSKTVDFTVTPGVVYLIDSTAGPVVVTLPAANVAGQTFAVKWMAGANAVTLQRAGSDTIGASATTAAMGLVNEIWEFLSSGTGQWNLIGGNKTLAALDGRYPLRYSWTPIDHNLLAWTCDPALVNSQSVLAQAGRFEFARLHLPIASLVTNILLYVGTAGGSLTAGQCFVSLHAASGALIAQSADQAAAWASTGLKTAALNGGARQVAAGDVYVGAWFNGTTGPALGRAVGGGIGNSAFLNAGLSSPNFRFGTANTSLTTTAPATMATPQSSSTNPWWFALS